MSVEGSPWQRGANGQWSLAGALTLASVARLRPGGRELIASAGTVPLTVDLTGVPAADSAGLALLIDWLAYARVRGVRLSYTGVGDSLRALARLSEVEELITGTG